MPAPTSYLTLLRGINVGGNNLIKMAGLREWPATAPSTSRV
jgi:uncharacterized protein (DUF1697 family)